MGVWPMFQCGFGYLLAQVGVTSPGLPGEGPGDVAAECPAVSVLQDNRHGARRGDWASLVCLPSHQCSPWPH